MGGARTLLLTGKPDKQPILQTAIGDEQRRAADRPLPGIQALVGTDWITVDDAYGAQMAERERLLAERPHEVLACLSDAHAPARELLEQVLKVLADRPDFTVLPDSVQRPDGQSVPLDRANPLRTLGSLVSEDLCLLQKIGDTHVLTAAVLCFPASWTLAEKIGKPLIGVHAPVAAYDAALAGRVQRLFDGVKPGRPIWRANLLGYKDPDLFQPRSENARRQRDESAEIYERSERQVIWRLPETNAVVFTIHTSVALARPDST